MLKFASTSILKQRGKRLVSFGGKKCNFERHTIIFFNQRQRYKMYREVGLEHISKPREIGKPQAHHASRTQGLKRRARRSTLLGRRRRPLPFPRQLLKWMEEKGERIRTRKEGFHVYDIHIFLRFSPLPFSVGKIYTDCKQVTPFTLCLDVIPVRPQSQSSAAAANGT